MKPILMVLLLCPAEQPDMCHTMILPIPNTHEQCLAVVRNPERQRALGAALTAATPGMTVLPVGCGRPKEAPAAPPTHTEELF